jgi:hypothetical protein
MKRTELQARRAWPAVRWAIFVVLVGIFASASAQETAVLTVESVTVPRRRRRPSPSRSRTFPRRASRASKGSFLTIPKCSP